MAKLSRNKKVLKAREERLQVLAAAGISDAELPGWPLTDSQA